MPANASSTDVVLASAIQLLADKLTTNKKEEVTKQKIGFDMYAVQADSTEVHEIPTEESYEGFARWDQWHGKCQRPPRKTCPSIAQLSCLKYMFLYDTPGVDFAIWGPHGDRLSDRLKLQMPVLQQIGYRTQVLSGPPQILTPG